MKSVMSSIRKAWLIIGILLLIGAITAVWRASGTVAYMVYYGMQFIQPRMFLLSAFLLCCLISFLLGTSFGTVGTVGVILMIMAKGSMIDPNMVAGAIIAGAYFGDRCSPMSSSANLVAAITGTKLYKNIGNMFLTTVMPFVLSLIIYGILSVRHPVYTAGSGIGWGLASDFVLNGWVMLPALVILILSLFRVDVKLSMLLSILTGAGAAVFVQHCSVSELLGFILYGYHMKHGFTIDIIKGGGIASMLNVGLVVLVSFSISGILESTGMLKEANRQVKQLSEKIGPFGTMLSAGVFAVAFGCSQVLAIMLTYQLVQGLYNGKGSEPYELAVDLENSVVVMAALIPWNIAGAVPAAALSVGAGYIPYAVYLYLLPLCHLLIKPAADRVSALKGSGQASHIQAG